MSRKQRRTINTTSETRHRMIRFRGVQYEVRGEIKVGSRLYMLIEDTHPNALIAFDPDGPRKVVIRTRDIRDRNGQGAFERRVLLAASANNRHVPHIIEHARNGSKEHLVLEFIEGKPLAHWLAVGRQRRKPYFSPDESLRLTVGLGHGLMRLHAARIVHGDLKPENLIVTPNNELIIIDFGIAWTGALARQRARAGTEFYAAPEQWTNQDFVNALADQFSATNILFEMLTNELPYGKLGSKAIEYEERRPQLVPPSRKTPTLGRAFDEVVTRGLALDPDGRFPSTSAWLSALKAVQDERSHSRSTAMFAEAFRSGLQQLRDLFRRRKKNSPLR